MVAMIVLGSLFAYAVAGVWSYRTLEARRQRNPNACHACGVCAFRVLGAILWPVPMPVLVSIAAVVGTANLPRRLSAWRGRRAEARRERLSGRIVVPPRAIVGLEDYRRLMPLIRRYEERMPIQERE